MKLTERVLLFVKNTYADYPKENIKLKKKDIDHLRETMETVMTMSDDEDMICAAGLHDILDKTTISIEEIGDIFNKNVAEMVTDIRNCYDCGDVNADNWMMEHVQMAIRISRLYDFEKVIVLSDFLSDVKLWKMQYAKIHDKVYKKYGAPKDEVISFYSMLKQSFSELSETQAYQEFIDIISKKPFSYEEFPYDTLWMSKLNCQIKTADIESTGPIVTRAKDQIILLLLNKGITENCVVPVISWDDILDFDPDNPNDSLCFEEDGRSYYAITTRPCEVIEHTINMKLTDVLYAVKENGIDGIVINPDEEYYMILGEWVNSVVSMSEKAKRGENDDNDGVAVILKQDDFTNYAFTINRPTEGRVMSAIRHFIKETGEREGDTVTISFKTSKPRDGIKKILVTSQKDSYKMELFYDMSEFDWENDLDLGCEGLSFEKTNEILTDLCELGKKDSKVPLIMKFKNITKES